MRPGLKRAAFGVLSLLDAASLLARRARRRRMTLVLNLHRVSPAPSAYWPPLHPDVFDELLRRLRRHLPIVSLSALPDLGGDAATVLSFDDGYHDFLEYAAPLLDRHGAVANQNVIPSCVLSGRPVWNVELTDYLERASLAEVRSLPVPGWSGRLETEDAGSKMRFGIRLAAYLKLRPQAERLELWAPIEARLRDASFSRSRMLNAAEIRELAGRHHFGVHSHAHDSMGFESDEFFAADLRRCQEFFRTELRLPLDTYAFPNGSYRPPQVELLFREGIRWALLVDERPASAESVQRGVLPRITMYGDSATQAELIALDYRLRGCA